ncbi:6-phosphogluconate dehydrogenase family protein [Tolypocladium paradoxum]|uniref:6-phosphogluconate dehydrogenase family protein n=1 Tax=Tolypocladium paradoxum TaxID=94208 RepID=A0A2S4KLJ7_9HYPO|nr:6-phosphogluconate dehydrogenase family protein [Tolypocladium paradoxum]
MGIGMALNLQNHLAAKGLPPLHYSNRTLSRGEPLKKAGAIPEDDFESVIKTSTIIFTMIANDDVLNDLVTKALEKGMSLEGKIWVDTSTVHPETSAECSERLGQKGATFIASPVFGASPVAAAGKLIFSMAGSSAAIDQLRPYILDVMGRSIINMGDDVRKSSLLKISGNIFVIGFQELIAEGLVFAEKTGLGTQQMEEFIRSMFGPVLESYSKRMTSGAWAPPLGTPPGFAVAISSKDTRHALSLAKAHGTHIPTLETALSRMTAAREYAGESLDSSSIYGIARLEAGLPFWSENSRQGN